MKIHRNKFRNSGRQQVWSDIDDNLIVADENCSGKMATDNNEDGDMLAETSSKVIEVMKIIRRVHILTAIQHL